MTNLGAWVPRLNLCRCKATRDGYEAVATWRASGTGRRAEQRRRNLKIHPNGIRDFGLGEGDADASMTPINLVMRATGCGASEAFVKLAGWVGWAPVEPVTIARKAHPAARMAVPAQDGDNPCGLPVGGDVAPQGREGGSGGTAPVGGHPGAVPGMASGSGGTAVPGGRVPEAPSSIEALPFRYSDPTKLPWREWLYGTHLIRGFLSCTVTPGGIGKSSLVLAEAVAMASGRKLLGVPLRLGKLRVWVINLEDPLDESERRVHAILRYYQIAPEAIEGQLFLTSGRDTPITLATQGRNGTVIADPIVDALTREIRDRAIDVLIVDPFVKSHRVSENDNGAIDAVATAFARIADATGCAIELVHHVRKASNANGALEEIRVEDGRGAVSLLAAVRSARVLNPVSKEAADEADVDQRDYFRVSNGKSNMARPSAKADWFRKVSVSLGNGTGGLLDDGDHIPVVEQWERPDLMEDVTIEQLRTAQKIVSEGKWREHVNSGENWVGVAVAEALGVDWHDPAGLRVIKRCLKLWLASGMLKVVEKQDAQRKSKKFVEVGEWASD